MSSRIWLMMSLRLFKGMEDIGSSKRGRMADTSSAHVSNQSATCLTNTGTSVLLRTASLYRLKYL